jgi:hypothetical protein
MDYVAYVHSQDRMQRQFSAAHGPAGPKEAAERYDSAVIGFRSAETRVTCVDAAGPVAAFANASAVRPGRAPALRWKPALATLLRRAADRLEPADAYAWSSPRPR